MTQLHQLIAVEKTAKSEANAAIDRAYKLVQKPDLFAGIARTYEPLAEDGQRLPAEAIKVQYRADEFLASELRPAWTRLLDLVATKDEANTAARADVVLDGRVVLSDVPVTYLIWLEKQLTDIRTVVSKLPTLDEAYDWRVDTASGNWVAGPTQTVKTTKVPRNHVLYPATEQHPAQVQMYTEDTAVGTWTTYKFSGAMPATRQRELLERIGRLLEAVKFAREEANGLEVTDRRVGKALFDFLLATSSPA